MAMSGMATFAPDSSWSGVLTWLAAIMGVSTSFPSLASSPLVWDSVKLLLLGSVIETGRRIFRWVVNRFRLRCSISAQFHGGNPTYEWLVSYLTKENVWRTPSGFLVEVKSSQRKWKVKTGAEDGQVDYVPLEYGSVHFFRWKGYWLEVTSPQNGQPPYIDIEEGPVRRGGYRHSSSLYLTIYTLDTSVLSAFVEECRLKYAENTKPYVTIYSTGPARGGPYGDPEGHWGTVKTKNRRPLDSLLLDEGVINSLLEDAREFLDIEDWYVKAGIPHRRGYLLHGPPGTGKTSTVYTVAGELGLEIYTLSLSTINMDDSYLARVVSLLPPRGILLIEDIDCAFPSRDDETELEQDLHRRTWHPLSPHKSQITLSGLLNVLDGIGSEEGKIFFATTNHIERLDPALLRPGRIDRKIEYKLASRKQAHALFNRFFPVSRFADAFQVDENPKIQYAPNTPELADEFSQAIPEHELSIAELQGYLLDYKMRPLDAVQRVEEWVESEREAKRDRKAPEQLRKEKAAAARAQQQLHVSEAVIAGIGTAIGHGQRSSRRRRRLPPPASVSSNDRLPDADPGTTSSSDDSEQDIGDKGTSNFGNMDVNGVLHSPPESPVPDAEVDPRNVRTGVVGQTGCER